MVPERKGKCPVWVLINGRRPAGSLVVKARTVQESSGAPGDHPHGAACLEDLNPVQNLKIFSLEGGKNFGNV